ncbi:MAG: TIGR03435 family protein [Vicinamibacterales bacterium]
MIVVPPAVSGQQSSRLAFDVASVRPNKSGSTAVSMRRLGGGFEAVNVTPRDLILVAFDVPRFAIADLPSWAESERFDVSARADASRPPAPANADMAMLRALLEDRFRLTVHTDMREMQVYALVMARRDGQPGPQLRRSTVDCQAAAAGAGSPCGGQNGPGFSKGVGRVISGFVLFLSSQVRRPVIDRTGLTGTWDIDLTFNPDSPDDPRPSLFTALQEQLGLRLEPSRAPVQVLVIDRIERPAEN